MDNIIVVNNLKKSFKEINAVNNISFTVKRGSLFAFLGLNGAGKSTTINILCSILKKNSGTVIIDGIDLDEHVKRIKERIGIVFQGSVLDDNLSVLENLKSRASLYSMSKKLITERILYLTGLLNLDGLLKRTYGTLSGGEKRRIDIARALIHEPKILFLDEPTTGLDPQTRVTVWNILDDLKKVKDLTIFLTTHYMEEVSKADDVVILDEGKIVTRGTPDELKSKYTSDFLRVIDKKSIRLDELLLKEKYDYEYKNNSYYIKVNSSKEALSILNKHEENFKDFEVIKGEMDDVFLSVTGKKLEVSQNGK